VPDTDTDPAKVFEARQVQRPGGSETDTWLSALGSLPDVLAPADLPKLNEGLRYLLKELREAEATFAARDRLFATRLPEAHKAVADELNRVGARQARPRFK
jgi:hypothetical protein